MKAVVHFAILLVSVFPATSDAFIPSNFVTVKNVETISLLVVKPSPSSSPVSASALRNHVSSTTSSPSLSSSSSLGLSSASFDPTSTSAGATFGVEAGDSTMAVSLVQNILSNSLVRSIASATIFVLIERIIKILFSAKHITFPSSLAGCCIMAITLLVTPFHARMYTLLNPGAKFLQRFLMICLVPNLIVLPLCGGCGSITEIAKICTVIVGGFLFSLLTTAGSVCVVRKMSNRSCTETPTLAENGSGGAAALASSSSNSITTSTTTADTTTTSTPKPKVFSDELMMGSRWIAVGCALAAVLSNTMMVVGAGSKGSILASAATTTPLVAVSLLACTVHTFCFGARLSKKITKIIHPLVMCTVLTWIWSYWLGTLTGTDFVSMIRFYRTGGPLAFTRSGAGDYLTFILGPAVVSLGVSIYERRKLIQQNLREVITATALSSLGGLFGTSLAVRMLCLTSAEVRLSLIPRNITSALAVAIAEIVGANRSFAVSFAVITGLLGANFGASVLNCCGIKDPVARGLGIGSASHGLGTAALVDEKDAFPFAAISMTLTAISGTILVSIPMVKKLALQIALGGM